jgi:SHS2 domain-containing protein
MNYRPFELISHTADVQLSVHGRTWPELLSNVLQGMLSITQPHSKHDAPSIQRTISVSGIDRELLLINFISECLYLADIYRETYEKFMPIESTETILKGNLIGKSVINVSLEIKAATYHELSVSYHHNLWHAFITFDI